MDGTDRITNTPRNPNGCEAIDLSRSVWRAPHLRVATDGPARRRSGAHGRKATSLDSYRHNLKQCTRFLGRFGLHRLFNKPAGLACALANSMSSGCPILCLNTLISLLSFVTNKHTHTYTLVRTLSALPVGLLNKETSTEPSRVLIEHPCRGSANLSS